MEHNIWIVRSRTSWCVYWSSSPLLDIRTWLFHYNIYFAQSLTLACLVAAKYIVYPIWPGLTNKTYFTYIITNIYYILTTWLAQTRARFCGVCGLRTILRVKYEKCPITTRSFNGRKYPSHNHNRISCRIQVFWYEIGIDTTQKFGSIHNIYLGLCSLPDTNTSILGLC